LRRLMLFYSIHNSIVDKRFGIIIALVLLHKLWQLSKQNYVIYMVCLQAVCDEIYI
jgi:divalent metal cation (Fe/Co/Zn/Cd) transporter